MSASDESAFDRLSSELEALTPLDRLEARGTVRIMLKGAGFDARSIQPDQMVVVIERLLAAELTARGIGDAESVCGQLVARMRAMSASGPGADSPEAVFARLGGAA